MTKRITRCQSWKKLSLAFISIFLVVIMLSGCAAPEESPTHTLTPSEISKSEPPKESPPPPPTTSEVVYSLSTNIDPPNSGSVTPNSGSYETGKTETLTARPNPGYTFDHWGGDASGTDTSISVAMNSNKSITAYFASIPTPPLNVTIHHIGIISAHDQEDYWDLDGEVQLVVAITDGQVDSEPIIIPPSGQGFEMGDFETKEINRRVFHTSSVGDYLKISIMAYDIDSNTETLNMFSMFEMLGAPGATEFKRIYSLLPQEDDFIGYYEHIWYSDENWGIGQYSAEGHEDLLVWFSIWSDTEPAPIPKPSLLPDVKIKNVEVPSTVSLGPVGLRNPYHTLILENNEDIDIKIDYFGDTPLALDWYKSPVKGTVNVPKRSSKPVTHLFQYTKEGIAKVTYTIFYNNIELDTWSGEVTVLP